MSTLRFPLLCLIACLPLGLLAQWQSGIVSVEPDGRLRYERDAEGNMIPDFSHAGYRGGGVDLPQVPTVLTIGPVAGDNTAHIQAAIDQVGAMPLDSQGFRGALLLDTGRYEIHGTLEVPYSGVVLRGVGDGADTTANTVLIGVGNVPDQRDILVLGGGSDTRWAGRVANTKVNLSSDRVLVGQYAIEVEDPGPFASGDNVVIYHPCTQAWLDAIDGGGTAGDDNWSLGSQPLVFNRRVVAIDGNTLWLDVPVYNTLDRSLSPSYVYVYDRAGLVTQVGLESLRIDIETAGGDDEAHAWNAVGLVQVEDAWVKGCTFLHFGLAGVYTQTATRVTIADCRALDPVAQVTGSRMYNFNLVQASSQVLVRNCHATNGRHHYVSNGTSSVSGCVFLRCTSAGAYTSSEGHRRWSMGLLYDNHVETSVRSQGLRLLALYNRGDYGTGHGWSVAHSVAWHCDVGTGQLLVQKPPTAQNYAIGCSGQINGNGPFNAPVGYIEGANTPGLVPESLYEAQLAARLDGLAAIITGTSAPRATSPWRLFPNPSTGILRVEAPDSQPFVGTVLDMQGRELSAFSGQGRWEGRLDSLPPGYYVLRLQQAGGVSWLRWEKR
ncbi:MAG: T9SS C-terminal target domain-containing protein [Bacteroidetes bacterium]|nr:MAG: T9SS C-terminal target domain-containing protein [Bacteroidota bacterium]